MDKKTILVTGSILIIIFISVQSFDFIAKRGAQNKLPNGLGKIEFINRCSSCHSVERVIHTQKPLESWESAILWMQKMQGMSPIPQAEKELIISYLESYFPIDKK